MRMSDDFLTHPARATCRTTVANKLQMAMLGVHGRIQFCKALLPVGVFGAALAARPESRLSIRSIALGGFAVAVAVASLVAPLASTAPDGLPRAAAVSASVGVVWSPDVVCPTLALLLVGLLVVRRVVAVGEVHGRLVTAKVRKS
ncbi:MAG TPA: hypothetical protein VHV08_15930 [Pirellulales bacterium]|jgi:hypothetical protein|nr:hypothetical protein [Pirellulales bacterium]